MDDTQLSSEIHVDRVFPFVECAVQKRTDWHLCAWRDHQYIPPRHCGAQVPDRALDRIALRKVAINEGCAFGLERVYSCTRRAIGACDGEPLTQPSVGERNADVA